MDLTLIICAVSMSCSLSLQRHLETTALLTTAASELIIINYTEFIKIVLKVAADFCLLAKVALYFIGPALSVFLSFFDFP